MVQVERPSRPPPPQNVAVGATRRSEQSFDRRAVTAVTVRRSVESDGSLTAGVRELTIIPVPGGAGIHMDDLDVARWLSSLGLAQYGADFARNDVDGEVLLDLTPEDLVAIGVGSVGHRRKILAAIDKLRTTSPERLAAERRDGGERRQLTVLFADLVGSSRLAAALDPEEMRDLIVAYQAAVSDVILRFGGHVAQYLGDGVLCYFGWPIAREDSAECAIRAGLDLVEAVEGLHAPDGAPLAARIGIATGLVLVGGLLSVGAAQEDAVIGDTPNRAARLQASAGPGAVVIADSTRRLVEGLFDLEPHPVDVAFSQTAFRVTGSRPVDSRFAARTADRLRDLVGRDAERDELLALWENALAGRGRMVLVVGDAGIGKSALARAVAEAIGGRSKARIDLQGTPHSIDTMLDPVIRYLKQAAGLATARSTDEQLDRLEAVQFGPQGDRPLLAHLVGLDGSHRYGALDLPPALLRRRIMEALGRHVAGLAAAGPILLIVEDLHWMDPTTLELLRQWAGLAMQGRLLGLCTLRPSLDTALEADPAFHVCRLGRLSLEAVDRLIGSVPGAGQLPAGLRAAIRDRTDGNPLFVEEYTKTVVEIASADTAKRDDEGGHAFADVPVPSSLKDSLSARLDRLQTVRDVARLAACIGREFDADALAAIAPGGVRWLDYAIRKLIAADVVRPRAGGAPGAFVFKHALVRDAAYESLLLATRKSVHARLHDLFEARPDRSPPILAHHAALAGLTERAVTWWTEAARQSAAQSANLEGMHHARRAVALVGALPEGPDRDRLELPAQAMLGTVSISVHGYAAPETGAAFARAGLLSRRVGDGMGVYATLSGAFAYHFVRGDPQEMAALTAEAEEIARATRDEMFAMLAHRFRGVSSLYRGELDEASLAFGTIVRDYVVPRHRPPKAMSAHDPKIYAVTQSAFIACLRGETSAARQWGETAVDYARELDNANMTAFVLIYARASVEELFGDVDAVRSLVRSIEALAERFSLHYFRLSADALTAWADGTEGRLDTAVTALRQIVDRRARLGAGWFQARYLAMLAEFSLQAGRLDEAVDAIRRAHHHTRDRQDGLWRSEVDRVAAEIRAASGGPRAAVDALFDAAESDARTRGAHGLASRVAESRRRLQARG